MDGVRRALPIVLGYVPVAFAFGVLAVKSNIPPALVVAMSVFHFAGSGQFVCAGLWGAGVGAMSVIVAVFVVNLRHLLMSAAMAEPLAPLKRWQRFLFGCEMTDETFGVHITAFQRGWKLCTATLFTCNLTAHASWVLGTVIGVFCGGLVHDVKPLGLDYALTAMFLALLVPQCVSRLHVLVAIVTAILSLSLKLAGMGQWNVVVATVLGATLGVILPSFVIITAISYVLKQFESLRAVKYAFMGIRAGVLALILKAFWNMARQIPRKAISCMLQANMLGRVFISHIM